MNTESDDKVLITGAGFAGLLLAHGLKKRQIGFHVYEQSSETSTRHLKAMPIMLYESAIGRLTEILDEPTMNLVQQFLVKFADHSVPVLDSHTKDATTATPFISKPCYLMDYRMLQKILIQQLRPYITFGKFVNGNPVKDEYATLNLQGESNPARGWFVVGAFGWKLNSRRSGWKPARPRLKKTRCVHAHGKMPLEYWDSMFGVPIESQERHFIDRTNAEHARMDFWRMPFPKQADIHVDDSDQGLGDFRDGYIFWSLRWKTRDGQGQRDATASMRTMTSGWHRHWKSSMLTLADLCAMEDVTSQLSGSSIHVLEPRTRSWNAERRRTFIGDAAHPVPCLPADADTAAVEDVYDLCNFLVEHKEDLRASHTEQLEMGIQQRANALAEKQWDYLKEAG